MHKLLFIGVGGTGGKALRFAWREIDRRLRNKGWSGDAMPASVQFVHFDLPERFDGYKDKDVPRVLSLDNKMYRNLADKPLAYRDYDNQLVADGLLRAATGWRPHPVDDIPDPFLGAGQRRSVGRAVTICSLGRIDEAIKEMATALTSSEAKRDLDELDRLFNLGAEKSQREGHVFIVGSLAGGSGSGMFLDVLERVRAHGLQWFSNAHLVAVTPDAFETGRASEREGVEPNSFAALAEYLAGFGWEGPLHPLEALIQGSAGAVGGTGRRTGERAFLIGRGNDDVSFNDPSEVFRCVGKALAAYATTPEIQSYFDSVVCNLNGSTSRPEFFFADRGSSPLQPVGAFGFGTVGVGGDLLGEYAAQRLALGCLDVLLSTDTGEETREEYVRRRTEADFRDRFFEASGLWEFDPTRSADEIRDKAESFHDQVLDALRDFAELKRRTEALKNRVIDTFSKDKRSFAGDQAYREFASAFASSADEFERTARDERSKRARAWTLKVQEQLLNATAEAAGRDGLAVAQELLDQLIIQLEDAAAQLADERAKATVRENQALEKAQLLYSRLKEKVSGSAQLHRDAATFRHAALFQRVENHTRLEAAQLIREAKDDLVAPLRRALGTAADSLVAELRDKNGPGAVADGWSRDAVPDSLKPAPNEHLLISPDAFPDELDRLLIATTGRSAPADAYAEAVFEIIRGGWADTRTPGETGIGSQTAISVTATWNSGLTFAQRDGAPSTAEYAPGLGILELLARARHWVRFRQGPLADHVNESLVEHLDIRHADHISRARAFVTALTNACNCAKPLITIDEGLRSQVHGDTTEVSPTMTALPIGPKHPAREGTEAVLTEFGIHASEVGRYFTTDNDAREINVFGFMTKSVHPVVVSSIMHPINAAWSQASASRAERAAFWNFRRARTLEMFIPLPPSLQRSLVRGWYVAALLGYLTGLDASGGAEAEPAVWSSQGWLAFPRPLLGEPVLRRENVLPALLESFVLCFLDVSKRSLDSTRAYARLIELGGVPATQEADASGLDELLRWLDLGERPHGKGELPPLNLSVENKIQALAEANPPTDGGSTREAAETRRQAVLEALSDPRRSYEAVREEEVNPTVFVPDRRWEIAGVVISALDELSQFIRGVELTGGTRTPVLSDIDV